MQPTESITLEDCKAVIELHEEAQNKASKSFRMRSGSLDQTFVAFDAANALMENSIAENRDQRAVEQMFIVLAKSLDTGRLAPSEQKEITLMLAKKLETSIRRQDSPASWREFTQQLVEQAETYFYRKHPNRIFSNKYNLLDKKTREILLSLDQQSFQETVFCLAKKAVNATKDQGKSTNQQLQNVFGPNGLGIEQLESAVLIERRDFWSRTDIIHVLENQTKTVCGIDITKDPLLNPCKQLPRGSWNFNGSNGLETKPNACSDCGNNHPELSEGAHWSPCNQSENERILKAYEKTFDRILKNHLAQDYTAKYMSWNEFHQKASKSVRKEMDAIVKERLLAMEPSKAWKVFGVDSREPIQKFLDKAFKSKIRYDSDEPFSRMK